MSILNIKNKDNVTVGTLNTTGMSQEAIARAMAAYIPSQTAEQYISYKMDEAISFGNSLKKKFIDENVALGITQLGLTNHVRKVMREVNDAIGSGSLKDAVLEITLIDPSELDSTIMSSSRLLSFRNKIEAFLAVPLATTWNQAKTW
jgi:hypothetical protein